MAFFSPGAAGSLNTVSYKFCTTIYSPGFGLFNFVQYFFAENNKIKLNIAMLGNNLISRAYSTKDVTGSNIQ